MIHIFGKVKVAFPGREGRIQVFDVRGHLLGEGDVDEDGRWKVSVPPGYDYEVRRSVGGTTEIGIPYEVAPLPTS